MKKKANESLFCAKVSARELAQHYDLVDARFGEFAEREKILEIRREPLEQILVELKQINQSCLIKIFLRLKQNSGCSTDARIKSR
jgi:hypothetical protein